MSTRKIPILFAKFTHKINMRSIPADGETGFTVHRDKLKYFKDRTVILFDGDKQDVKPNSLPTLVLVKGNDTDPEKSGSMKKTSYNWKYK